jgi:hypothetical protein
MLSRWWIWLSTLCGTICWGSGWCDFEALILMGTASQAIFGTAEMLRKDSRPGRKDVPQGLKSLREKSHCVVPSGLDLREILPGTPVPGYRLSRPFGTDCVG